MKNMKKMQNAVVKSADGSMHKLAVVGRRGETVLLCSPKRYRSAASVDELEAYVVGFPAADVTVEGDPSFSVLWGRIRHA